MQHPKTQDQRPNIRLHTHTHIMAVHDTQSKKDTLSQYTVTLPKHTTTHTHRPTIKTRQKKHQYLKIPDPKTQDLKTKYQTTHTYDGNTRHTIIRDKDTHTQNTWWLGILHNSCIVCGVILNSCVAIMCVSGSILIFWQYTTHNPTHRHA